MNCPHCNRELSESEVLSLYGSLMGHRAKGATSERKRRTSAENGKKGGRPKGAKSRIVSAPAVKAEDWNRAMIKEMGAKEEEK